MKEEKINKSIDIVVKYVGDGKAVLNTVSNPVEKFDKSLEVLLDSLAASLYFYSGLGISAIQIGIPLRVLLIKSDDERYVEFINPEVLELSEEMQTDMEGCLSFPNVFVAVDRPTYVVVRYKDRFGVEKDVKLDGIHARCFLHEYDHLNGVTFLDHMSLLKKELVLKKLNKLVKTNKLTMDELAVKYMNVMTQIEKEKDKNEIPQGMDTEAVR